MLQTFIKRLLSARSQIKLWSWDELNIIYVYRKKKKKIPDENVSCVEDNYWLTEMDLNSSNRKLGRKYLAWPAISKGGFTGETRLLLSEAGRASSLKRGVEGRFQADDLTGLDRV